MSDIVDRLSRTLSDFPGDDDALFAEINEQRHEAIAEIRRLREALECLIDEQNGPPLEVHAKSWCAAMDLARAALAGEKKDE